MLFGVQVLNYFNSIHPDVHTKLRFAEAYVDDEEMKSVDIVMCFHPASACELFMPLEKRLFVIAASRYEMGREIPSEWLLWNRNLRQIASDPKHFIGAINLYDVKYIEYFTGITPTLIPAWIPMEKIWTGESLDILVADMRTPGSNHIMRSLRSISPRFKSLRSKYGTYKYHQLAENTAIIHFPYQVCVMSLFEQYGMGIPILVPSPSFLWELHDRYDVVSQRTWHRILTRRERPRGSPIPGVMDNSFDPNNDYDKKSFLHWIEYADYYQWPHIIKFNSWADLAHIITHQDWDESSANMLAYHKIVLEQTKQFWNRVLTDGVPTKNVQKYHPVVPSMWKGKSPWTSDFKRGWEFEPRLTIVLSDWLIIQKDAVFMMGHRGKPSRALVYYCAPSDPTCQRAEDRMKGIFSVFLLAVASRRAFFIDDQSTSSLSQRMNFVYRRYDEVPYVIMIYFSEIIPRNSKSQADQTLSP